MMMKVPGTAIAAALLFVCAAKSPARSADIAPAPDTSTWQFTLAPYVWGVGLNGDVGIFGREPVGIDIPFSDILQNLDFAAMGVAEAHNGTWGVLADINYTSLSAQQSVSRVILDRPNVAIKAKLKADLDVTEFVATVMGEWRAIDNDMVSLDLMVGARYWNVENDLSLRLKLNNRKIKELSGSDGAEWVDPMIGVKTRVNTSTPVYFTGWGMIGGFGMGSDLDWDVMGGIGYQWTEKFSTVAGYRALGVNYDNDGFYYNVIQQGVTVGAVFTF